MTAAVEKANADVPANVSVPASWAGLAMWVAGKWGIGIPIAGVFAWFLMTVYSDLRAEGNTKVEMVKGMMELQSANVQAINAVSDAVKQNTAELKTLRQEFDHSKPPRQ